MTRKSRSHGQTSMEFTIILAVVLIVGLIVIGLAMSFSMGAGEVSNTEVRTYWAMQAKPLRILDMQGYYYSANVVRGKDESAGPASLQGRAGIPEKTQRGIWPSNQPQDGEIPPNINLQKPDDQMQSMADDEIAQFTPLPNYPGEIALVIENIDSVPITIKGILMEPNDGSESFVVSKTHSPNGDLQTMWDMSEPTHPIWDRYNGGIRLASNGQAVVYIRNFNVCHTGGTLGSNKERYKKYLILYYDTPDFTGLRFRGIKPIQGPCSPI